MKLNLKRLLDIVGSATGIMLLLPLLIIIAVLVVIDSRGPIFFKQKRVGLNMIDFHLLKFRTMYVNNSSSSLLTIGKRDSRITHVGYWLRRYKLDELPQLINVLRGDMSLVGPRPEVRKYVNLYDDEQRYVLSIKPGITDWASVQFFNECELLEKADDPENYYIKNIIPIKINQNLKYVTQHDIFTDLKIIWLTLYKIILN